MSDDLSRVRRGGIPAAAERRLKRATTSLFTSDLSAKEYALAQASGMRPLAQVMGSSVVQRTEVPEQAGSYWGSSEIRALSDPWNIARERAFQRLGEEARCAGADAVIGVAATVHGEAPDSEFLEYVVLGTAVRDTAFPLRRGETPAICTLSEQDVYTLRRIGGRICGVAAHTTANSVKLEAASNAILNSRRRRATTPNAELPELARGFADTRRRALTAARGQAGAAGANHMVVSTLTHTIEHHHDAATRRHFFYIVLHVVATAIRYPARQPYPASMPSTTVTIGLDG